MKTRIRIHPWYAAFLLGLILALWGVGVVLAAGNIDATHKYPWSTNAGWINFAPDNGGVTVYSDHLEGYAWGENIGWIRLGTHTGGGTYTYANDAAGTYGVNRNTTTGALSGYAWSSSAGWINFAPSNGGVTVSLAGEFSGYAWGENIGWIKFNGTATDSSLYKVAASSPLAVAIASFTAQPDGDAIRLAWETVSEVDLLGFNLERAASAAGPWRRLNAELIAAAAPGASQGQAYTWDDKAVMPGPIYWYRLDAVEVSSTTTVVAIVSAQLPAPPAPSRLWLPLLLR